MRFLSTTVILLLALLSASCQPLMSMSINEYYVSKAGNNLDGLSWETAWNELDQIQWSHIQAGAVITIDGGLNGMRYETELELGASGTESAPIQILVSTEIGHQGQVTFFGGRANDLPYCGQEDYEDLPPEQMRDIGIRSNNHDFVSINGQTWRGILIHGYRVSGIRIEEESSNIHVQYVEVYNNGEAEEHSRGWSSSHAGIGLAGENITFRRVIVHDNGQDAFQSLDGDNNLHNFSLEQSWLYNGRRHPTVDESANYCTHTDGIQLYDGGDISGITIQESIIGPGFTQNILFGQTRTRGGSWADVHDVIFQDVVFTKAADNNVMGYRNTDSRNWLLDRVTIDCLETKSHCLRIDNSNHTVRDSIIVNGLITFPDGLDDYNGNCVWNSEGFDIGAEAEPLFVDVSLSDLFALDDYTPAAKSSCRGSRMASVEQLLALD